MAAHSNALLRVFQKNLFPDVEKDQNTQSVKVLDLNLKQDQESSNALLRVFQKNLFPDVEKDQNTQSVKVLDLNLKQDLPPDIKTTRFVKVKE